MTLWRLTTREMRRRPGRALLTLLSIAIGMAAIVAVSLGTATTREAYRRMYEEVAGHAALQVTSEGAGTFPENLAAGIGQVGGVKAAVPSLQRRTLLYFQGKRFDLLMMGIDPAADGEARDYELREGRLLSGKTDNGVLLEAGFAEGAGIRLGDQVKIHTARIPPLKLVPVVGLLAPRGAAGFNKGGVVFVPLGLAQRWFTRSGQVNTMDLILQPGADENLVSGEVKQLLPAGLELHAPASRTQLARETSVIIEQGLLLASYFAVALAIIIILNTFLMNVSERRRQLAILRTVGATRWQIVGMLLGEGLAMGAAGTVLGCLLGAGGGYLLMVSITRIYVGTPPPVIFNPSAFILAGVLGPLVAILAALIPALWTTRISPLESMRPLVAKDGARIPPWLTVAGLVLALVTGGLVVVCVRGWIPLVLCILVMVMFVASFVPLIPWLIGPLGRTIAWLLSPVLRLEGRLAHRQVRRRPVRTALTAGVLYMAVAVGVGLGTTIINSLDQVRSWHRRTIVGDFFLRGAFPDAATGQAVELPMKLGDDIRQIPGVTNVDTMRFFNVDAGEHRAFVVACEFTADDLPLDLYRGEPAEVRRRLLQGEVVVGTVLAQRAGLNAGDEITIDTHQGPKNLRIAALTIDYMVGGYVIYIRRSLAQELFGIEGADAFLVKAAADARPDVQTALKSLAQEQGLMLHSFAELSQMLDTILSGVVGGLWGILVLGFIVAAFGIANTLTMNVLEQTRELALLRVVAMTRGQVRKMVLSQAGLIGLIGLVLGTLAGIGTAQLISLSMMPLLGYPVDFALHPYLLAGCFGIGLVLVLLAALLPAERAARLDLLIALQYE